MAHKLSVPNIAALQALALPANYKGYFICVIDQAVLYWFQSGLSESTLGNNIFVTPANSTDAAKGRWVRGSDRWVVEAAIPIGTPPLSGITWINSVADPIEVYRSTDSTWELISAGGGGGK